MSKFQRQAHAALIAASIAAAIPSLCHGEVIKIPVGSQNAASAANTPPTGMLKPAVLSTYGEPQQRHPAVGTPPIERWDYGSFSVYFEYDHVVHSVMKGPKPPQ